MRTCADVDMLFVILSTKLIRERSLFIALGAGTGEDFRGDHLTFRRTKWGISRNRTQKGRSLKTLEGFRGGPVKFAWKMKIWAEGSRKSSNVIREGSLQ